MQPALNSSGNPGEGDVQELCAVGHVSITANASHSIHTREFPPTLYPPCDGAPITAKRSGQMQWTATHVQDIWCRNAVMSDAKEGKNMGNCIKLWATAHLKSITTILCRWSNEICTFNSPTHCNINWHSLLLATSDYNSSKDLLINYYRKILYT